MPGRSRSAHPLRLHPSLHCDSGRLTSIPCTITVLQSAGRWYRASDGIRADEQQIAGVEPGLPGGQGPRLRELAQRAKPQAVRLHCLHFPDNFWSYANFCTPQSSTAAAQGGGCKLLMQCRAHSTHGAPAVNLPGPRSIARVALDIRLLWLGDAGVLLVRRHPLPRVAAAVGDVRKGCNAAAARGGT